MQIEDPYRFGPQISESDLYLHSEGTLHEGWLTLGAHIIVQRRRRRRALRGVGAECRDRLAGRRIQRLGHAAPSHAAAQRRRVGTLRARPRRGRFVQVQRALALRGIPAAEGRPLRVLLRIAAEIGVARVGQLTIPMAGRGVDGDPRRTRQPEIAGVGVRSPPRILDARPHGSDAHVSRAGGQAGGVREADGLHPHRAAARHGASVLRVVGLPGDRLFRAHLALRHAGRFQVLRRCLPPGGNRRDRRLGARALPQGRARAGVLRRHGALRARRPAQGRAPANGARWSSTTAATKCARS